MPDPAPGTPAAFAVDPEAAIGFLRRKMNVPTKRWTDIWQDMHSVGFMVAGAQADQLLADFHDAVNRNIAEGRTLEQFRGDFDRIVAEHGWSYNGSRNWRSRVIFNTNLRTAYSAGRWAQVQAVKPKRPYLRYVAVMDARTRKEHAAWHNTVLPVDDPWWDTHNPPNGWNCRCTIQSLNERDLDRYGLKVSDEAPPVDLVPREINTSGGKVTVEVPRGIDPGFGYNPGAGAFGRGPENLALTKHGGLWPPLEPAPGVDPKAPLPELPRDRPAVPLLRGASGEAAIRSALRAALGGDEAVLVDPAGGRVRVGQSLADHWLAQPDRIAGREQYIPLIPSLVRDPAEIWLGWASDPATGKVALRRRYLKLIDTGGGRIIGAIVDADQGEWSGLTFFSGRRGPRRDMRNGLLIYRR